MSVNSRSVLVTGGAGYIGAHTCKALSQAGYLPVTYDNLSTGHRGAVRWGPLEVGDILDRKELDRVLSRYNPQAVLHFAALAYVGESMTDPARYWRNNVAGSLSILESMVSCGFQDMVFSSTCATYGEPARIPITEAESQHPINPYGTTKLVVESMLGGYAGTGRINSVSLRYFNAAGADPEGEAGECHDPETHLIPLVLMAARSGSDPLTVFGTDYPTPDGTCIRDYIHVTDLARAHVLALDYLAGNNGAHAFNLGHDSGISIMEIIQAAGRITGREIPYDIGPRRAGDPPVLVSQSDLARSQLGWKTRYSDIETIINTAWNWLNRLDQTHE